jgi:hypothetical protein
MRKGVMEKQSANKRPDEAALWQVRQERWRVKSATQLFKWRITKDLSKGNCP